MTGEESNMEVAASTALQEESSILPAENVERLMVYCVFRVSSIAK